MRAHNFGAGPAALPLPVLEKAREEMLDFNGSGMSIMEMSHRSATYQAVIDAAEAGIRKLLAVPENYTVLFLQGGASMQFAMLTQNLRLPGQSADYIHTGAWAEKAFTEAKITGEAKIIWDGKATNYMSLPEMSEIKESPNTAFVHITSNETIGGIQFRQFPKTTAPLISDMSSDIMSRQIKVADFGIIYAGAQKNIGPSGLALVIIRTDLLDRCPDTVNKFYRYRTHAKEGSMYNTPNTWAIYLVKLICDWIEQIGGLDALEKLNTEKAEILYAALDTSDYWKPCAAKNARSLMNVTWRMANELLEEKFAKESAAAGLKMLKGHRSVGGLRASIYNACTKDAVLALTQFMRDFMAKNG